MTDYPSQIKSFYMKKNADGKTMQGTDVLFPRIGEIIGGSVREESYDKLLEEIHIRGMKEEVYDWYLDTRKYGTCPHGGFGLGFERLILFVTGMQNIRDVIPFARTPRMQNSKNKTKRSTIYKPDGRLFSKNLNQ